MTGLQVIGAGFGRTGTRSLKKALEMLGYGPVYHGWQINRDLKQSYHWREYYRTGTTDWDAMFRRFRSAVDYPVCLVWDELAAHYPEAKIILTVRNPDSWWRSTNSTIYPARKVLPAYWRFLVPAVRVYNEFFDGMVWDGIFDGRFEDRDHAMKVFEQHIAEVKATADPDRLLVFDLADGWGPLCEFLDVPVPSVPFPRVNDAARTNRYIRITAVSTRALPFVAAAAAALGIWRAKRR